MAYGVVDAVTGKHITQGDTFTRRWILHSSQQTVEATGTIVSDTNGVHASNKAYGGQHPPPPPMNYM
jgi:hypothetical protein